MVSAIPVGGGGVLTRVLVTGAAGYVGSRLCEELLARPGTAVRAAIRKPVGWLEGVEEVVVELPAIDRSVGICMGVDSVIHLAGPNEVAAAREPERALIDTVAATHRICRAAVNAGVKRFIYLSTVHVYGGALEPGAMVTEATVPAPRTAYAIARLAAEHVVTAAATEGMDAVVLRLTNSVGAPAHPSVDRWTLIANDLCRQAVTKGSLTLRSDGTQWRDFVPLTAVCRLLADAASGALGPGTYNAGSGKSMTVRQLAELIQEMAGSRLGHRPPIYAPPVSGASEPRWTVAVEKLDAAGYRLPTDIRGAIDETVRFCIERKDQLSDA